MYFYYSWFICFFSKSFNSFFDYYFSNITIFNRYKCCFTFYIWILFNFRWWNIFWFFKVFFCFFYYFFCYWRIFNWYIFSNWSLLCLFFSFVSCIPSIIISFLIKWRYIIIFRTIISIYCSLLSPCCCLRWIYYFTLFIFYNFIFFSFLFKIILNWLFIFLLSCWRRWINIMFF